MRELLGRISALDPEAGAAVKVIAYFDELAGTGLEPVVRGAAVLTGVPAGFVGPGRDPALRVAPDGSVERGAHGPDPSWCSVRAGGGVLWLELAEEPGPVEAMVLERAAAAVRARMERTAPMAGGRAALAEALVDPGLPEEQRARAARRFGIVPGSPTRAVALHGGGIRVVAAAEDPGGERAGVGPAVEALGLPSSWEDARRALRFTARGTGTDPGPRVVFAEDLGGLLLLADTVRPGDPPVPDVAALERVARDAAPLLAALEAVASSPSLRAAAARAGVHHSTLQESVGRAERLLGWPVREVTGRLRLQVALVLRRLHHHP
ncbi:CdaR family transcriptional regulator [Nocardiopsis sp. TSRI0078]|uniref:helix-turn-helix domain-containing protein n=1 Tax=unclassified Nocardiopsis TaxID=2649073 RepID=UPI00093C0430|nr:helix-turn-helix domain-containing protein [Nocardiopsis sp. TSRI0078]OKI12378.1 CdaR family transcriptional regulator [Nocardiopsis sp. TSRI0078]